MPFKQVEIEQILRRFGMARFAFEAVLEGKQEWGPGPAEMILRSMEDVLDVIAELRRHNLIEPEVLTSKEFRQYHERYLEAFERLGPGEELEQWKRENNPPRQWPQGRR